MARRFNFQKIRAVIEANTKAGKDRARCAPYGYVKSNTENRLPVPDEPAASIVKRIFELRAKGVSPRHICDMFDEEHIPTSADYAAEKHGIFNSRTVNHLWYPEGIRRIISNPLYLGLLVQPRTTTVSYKNHKVVKTARRKW